MSTDPDVRDVSEAIDDDTHVEISVVHGSVANAEYPLMIGGFEGEQFGGHERFLDRQFGGLLTSCSRASSARRASSSRADLRTRRPNHRVAT
jgi:hypothetical protein